MLQQCQAAGVPPHVYANAANAGPLATFDGRTTWAESAYRHGVALLGDAAANTDPTWGQGLSMALRDARILLEQLLSNDDWHAAGQAYAEARRPYFNVVHTMENWQTQLLMDTGPDADAIRARRPAKLARRSHPQPRHLPQRPRRTPNRIPPPPLFRRSLTDAPTARRRCPD